jgi:hypothetical protein
VYKKIFSRPELICQIILLILGIAGGIYVSITPANSLMRWYDIDDAFYYYKVAQNFLTGYGFSFDQINLSNGFHPLWMVICLSVFWLSRFNLLLPLRVLVIVSALFNALTGVVLFRFASKFVSKKAAFIGSLTWVLLPTIYGTVIEHGMEAAVSAFFMVLLLSLTATTIINFEDRPVTKTRLILIGLIGGLTILSRLDNVFLVTVVGFFLLLRVRKISPILLFDLAAIVLASFLSWIIRLGTNIFEIDSYSIYPMVLLSFVIKPALYYFFGCYTQSQKPGRWREVLTIGMATGVASIIEFGILTLLFQAGIIRTLSKAIIAIDAVITLVLVVLVHLFWKRRGILETKSPWSDFWNWVKKYWNRIIVEGVFFALPIAGILGAYISFNKSVFGTFAPVSGQIKQWWSTLPNTIYGHKNSLITLLGLSPSGNYGPWSLLTSKLHNYAKDIVDLIKWDDPRAATYMFIVLFICLAVVIILFLRGKDNSLGRKVFQLLIPAVFLGAFIQIAYYTSVGYQHTRGWYWVAEMLALVLLGTVLLDGIFTWLKSNNLKRIASIVLFLGMCAYLSITHANYIWRLAPLRVSPENVAAYLYDVKQLEFYTPEGSLIGMTGGGSVAYFIENRRIVNLDGLINSNEYFYAMKNGTARDFLDKLPLDFAYGNSYALQFSDPYKKILESRLVEVGFINGIEKFTLYKYEINQ